MPAQLHTDLIDQNDDIKDIKHYIAFIDEDYIYNICDYKWISKETQEGVERLESRVDDDFFLHLSLNKDNTSLAFLDIDDVWNREWIGCLHQVVSQDDYDCNYDAIRDEVYNSRIKMFEDLHDEYSRRLDDVYDNGSDNMVKDLLSDWLNKSSLLLEVLNGLLSSYSITLEKYHCYPDWFAEEEVFVKLFEKFPDLHDQRQKNSELLYTFSELVLRSESNDHDRIISEMLIEAELFWAN